MRTTSTAAPVLAPLGWSASSSRRDCCRRTVFLGLHGALLQLFSMKESLTSPAKCVWIGPATPV
jgi:hypothetical protein